MRLRRALPDWAGGLILNASVQKIDLNQGKVAGVWLQSGEALPADAVVAAIHPKVLLDLLDYGALRASLRERILTLEETDGVMAVQASVDAVSAQGNRLQYLPPASRPGRLHPETASFIR